MSRSELRRRVVELLSAFQGSSIPQSHIHRSIDASKSRISEILAELEKEGLIRRNRIGRSNIVQVLPGIREREERALKKNLKLGIVFSSEYLFLGHFLKKMREASYNVEVAVYRNSVEAVDDLVHGKIDLSISPFVGQLLLYPAYESYKILPLGMGRGYRVVQVGEGETVYSSKLSTMDYIRGALLRKRAIEASETRYYSSPDELFQKPREKRGYIVTWHPVYKKFEEMGYKAVDVGKVMENELCCSLAISNVLGEEGREEIARIYRESLYDYVKIRGRFLEAYSAIVGIDLPLLKDALNEYEVFEGDGPRAAEEVLANVSTRVPHKTAFLSGLLKVA